MKEEWKDTHVFSDCYQVSSHGNVKSKRGSKRLIKQSKNNCGYAQIMLCVKGERVNVTVHRLVGIAFIENKENKPCINHKDSNRLNNSVENLEWCTSGENNKHARDNDRTFYHTGESHPMSKLTANEVIEIRKRRINGEKAIELAISYGVCRKTINNVCNGHNWSHI